MKKELTYEEYHELLGKVPEGKRLVQTSTYKYYIEDVVIHPILITKKPQKKKK